MTQAAPAAPLSLCPGTILESHESRAHYALERRLGAGSFGQVWLCRDERGEERAVKVMPGEDTAAMATEVASSQSAVESVGEYHVPKFYEASEGCIVGNKDAKYLFIVMQFIDGPSAGQLRASVEMPESITRVVLHDVAVALARLHQCGIIHRDVKGDNILVSRSGLCYLCDFGVSAFEVDLRALRERQGRMSVCGTPFFMAPELMAPEPRYDAKIDVWSFGITTIELASGSAPLQGQKVISLEQVFQRIARMPEPRAPDDLGFSHALVDLVDRCMVRDPEQRASASQLLRCKYLRGLGHEGCEHVGRWLAESWQCA